MISTREGYKKTELGSIPNDWCIKTFKSVCSIVNGLVDPQKNPYNSYPHIGNANIEKNTGRLLNFNIAKDDNLVSGKYLFNENHVLYGKINPQFAKATFPKFTGICSADMYPFECDMKHIIPSFLLYSILDSRYTKTMVSNSSRTGMPKVNRQEVESYKFILPPLDEQRKIAEILSTVDEQIDQTNQLIEKTKELKKGLMQELLTKGIGHSKFKQTKMGEIPFSWEHKRLEDISAGKGEYGIGASATTYSPSKPRYLRITDIDDSGRISNKDIMGFESESFENYIVREGDILFARTGNTTGKTYIYKQKDGPLVFAGFLIRFHINSQLADAKFVFYFMQTKIYWDWVKIMSSRSGQPGINSKQYSDFILPVPPIGEQKKIAAILSSVDEDIEGYEQEKTKYEELKKGLMQQLLTGKTRVKVD